MFLVTWLSNHESSTPCRLLPNLFRSWLHERDPKIKDSEAQEEKKIVVYQEQYKVTMVDQELDKVKVVEGEWPTKSKAPSSLNT